MVLLTRKIAVAETAGEAAGFSQTVLNLAQVVAMDLKLPDALNQAPQSASAPAPTVAPAPAPAATQPAPTETRTFTPSAPPPSAPGEMAFAEAQQRLAAVAQRLGSPQRVIEVMQQFSGPPLTAVSPAAYAQLVAQAEALQ